MWSVHQAHAAAILSSFRWHLEAGWYLLDRPNVILAYHHTDESGAQSTVSGTGFQNPKLLITLSDERDTGHKTWSS
jgi:hypothetical protein